MIHGERLATELKGVREDERERLATEREGGR